MSSTPLFDQEARQFFRNQIDKNISLIAPAGVGKTHAIIQRIIHILRSQENKLSSQQHKLVVVTYTKKAAYEMEKRVRDEWNTKINSLKSANALNTHFFGTIHSFCLELIQKFGHHLRMPSDIEICTDETSLWLEYIRSNFFLKNKAIASISSKIHSYCSAVDMYSLIQQLDYTNTGSLYAFKASGSKNSLSMQEPILNFESILNFETANKRLKPGIEKEKIRLLEWIETWKEGLVFEVPQPTAGGEDFLEHYTTVFRPLRDWLGHTLIQHANLLALDFQAYRLQQGLLTYNDLISLAHQLLQNSKAHKEILFQNYAIVLDEAQDSDRLQLEILLRCVTPYTTQSVWPFNSLTTEPPPGKFCIVGDPQQSIYGNRANLHSYLQLHEAFKNSNHGHVLEFSVTFRCAQDIVECANTLFPKIFDKEKAHVISATSPISYVTMQARPNANLGQVCKYILKLEKNYNDPESILTLAQSEEQEIQALSTWLKKIHCKDLQAKNWSEVAILCPRNDWLKSLAQAFQRAQIPHQLHIKEFQNGDSALFAWVTALTAIMLDPCDGYEIAGVLREIFGVKDSDMAHYVLQQQESLKEIGLNPLHIYDIAYIENNHPVGKLLTTLAQLRSDVIALPLRTAIEALINNTQILERVFAISHHEEKILENNVYDVYSKILTLASHIEQDKKTLYDFFQKLKKIYQDNQAEPAIQEDCIQLLTCHSAKGLEWDAVIVPFLYRPISFKNEAYPRLLRINSSPDSTLQSILAIDGLHKHEKHEEEIQKTYLNELKRLLYVTLTRPRNTLLFIEDKSLFKASNEHSFGSLLCLSPETSEEGNKCYFDQLPIKDKNDSETSKIYISKKSEDINTLALQNDPLSKINSSCVNIYLKGIQNAQSCIKKIIPSKLNNSKFETIYKASTKFSEQESDFAQYGTWWHFLMQYAPWKGPLYDLKKYFFDKIASAPQEERAFQEIELLLKSPWFEIIYNPKTLVETEVPILGALDNKNIYEGVVDLALHIPMESKIILLDWKTDSVSTSADLDQLTRIYEPQLNIYKTAVSQAYQEHIEMHLYSTKLGASQQI